MAEALTCVYVTDRGFLPCTSFSILSLVAGASVPLDIHVLYTDSDAAARTEAERFLAGKGVSVTFHTISADAFAGLPPARALPLSTYGRLLMHQVLPARPRRVLYIDGDTLVDIDVAPLATLALKGNPIGAVLDIGRILVGRRGEAQRRLDLGPDGDYFNAGMLLIDWPQWRAKGLGEATFRALVEDPARFVQADQCALNYICRGQWTVLEQKWNYQPANVLYADRSEAIFHFLGGKKPWDGRQTRHPVRFVTRYRDLYGGSPWAHTYRASQLPLWAKSLVRLARGKGAARYWANHRRYHHTAARIAALASTGIEAPSPASTEPA